MLKRSRQTELLKILAALLAAAGNAHALEVGVGHAAPPLKPGAWIKGAPVDLEAAKGKNLVVVEFWATWCPPCRMSIPHLTELQKKYKEKGLLIVGVSNESADRVKPFVEAQGAAMDYIIAVDTAEQDVMRGYMEAFGITGIPWAFLIDKSGRIVWHGNPLDEAFGKAIDDVLADKYDIEAFKKADEPRMLEAKKLNLFRQYFDGVILKKKPAAELAAVGEAFITASKGDAMALNQFAWVVLQEVEPSNRDLPLALRAAQGAVEASEGTLDFIVDTYARALFDNGRVKEAVEQQKKAIDVCKDPKKIDEYRKRLERYEKTGSDA
ncbi:MAG: redoxin family protein [Phycisphaerae bacterium]|nr:MAG: hypothetical protein EDS66_11490 [Planctomycetota bacterium]KAB2940583.1 MAG: redoxin domain-containing protein [Phycisphaerae bacterium]MBE7458519.1 redoxin family protein [Planctomycetia bacterium]MCK6465911.1 redoxin family protein [Phycisphaerae bacterium]MCL4719599.1 redoxin family protein [Phycisphaerae bacterium]